MKRACDFWPQILLGFQVRDERDSVACFRVQMIQRGGLPAKSDKPIFPGNTSVWVLASSSARSGAGLTFQADEKLRGHLSTARSSRPQSLRQKADIAKVRVGQAANIPTESDFHITCKVRRRPCHL
jgi:hypothetical protein